MEHAKRDHLLAGLATRAGIQPAHSGSPG